MAHPPDPACLVTSVLQDLGATEEHVVLVLLDIEVGRGVQISNGHLPLGSGLASQHSLLNNARASQQQAVGRDHLLLSCWACIGTLAHRKYVERRFAGTPMQCSFGRACIAQPVTIIACIHNSGCINLFCVDLQNMVIEAGTTWPRGTTKCGMVAGEQGAFTKCSMRD